MLCLLLLRRYRNAAYMLHAHTCVRTYENVYAIYVLVYIYADMHILCMHACMHVCMYVCMYVCM